MNTRLIHWALVGLLTMGLGSVLALERARLQQVRAEIELARHDRRELARVMAEHERLRAAQPTAAEWEQLRAQEAARLQQENEIGQLRAKLAARPAQMKVPEPRATPPLQASAWSNAGRASPEAVLETALWAAISGEIEALADTLMLEPDARAQAEALLARLPAAVRANYATPERLVALLTAREVPGGTMQLIARMERTPSDVLLRVRLQQPDGSSVTRSLVARGEQNNWRLVVPANAIKRFETMLRGPQAAPAL